MNQLPPKFIERLQEIFPNEKHCADALAAFENPRPVTFRVNTLKGLVDGVVKELRAEGVAIEQIGGFTNAFVLQSEKRKFMEATAYTNGLIYIQNLSSMLPAVILNPKPGEKVLDIAAAPGSKTTQIASLLSGKGELVANEKSRSRIYKLQAVLKDQRVTNVTIENFPGEILWHKYPEYFDKALVDVPCSMEGRFVTTEPETYRDWSPKKVKSLIQTQRYLLRSAVSCTRPGGVIVYSTCTLEPDENEGVVDWLLRVEKGDVEVEEVGIENLEFSKGMIEWRKKSFDKSLEKTVRIVPSEFFEGFYVAKIRKLRSTISL